MSDDRYLLLRKDIYGQWLVFPEELRTMTLKEALRVAEKRIKVRLTTDHPEPEPIRLVKCDGGLVDIDQHNIEELTGRKGKQIIERRLQEGAVCLDQG